MTDNTNPKIHSIPAFNLAFNDSGDIASVNVTVNFDRAVGGICEGDYVRVNERYLVYTTPTEVGVSILHPRGLDVAVPTLSMSQEMLAALLVHVRLVGKNMTAQLPQYTEAWVVPAKHSTVNRGLYRVVGKKDIGFLGHQVRLTLEPATDMQDNPALHDDRTTDEAALRTTAVVDVSDSTTDDITDGSGDDTTVEGSGTAPAPNTTIRPGDYYWFVRNGRAIRTRHRNTEEDRRRVEKSEAFRQCPLSFGGGDE